MSVQSFVNLPAIRQAQALIPKEGDLLVRRVSTLLDSSASFLKMPLLSASRNADQARILNDMKAGMALLQSFSGDPRMLLQHVSAAQRHERSEQGRSEAFSEGTRSEISFDKERNSIEKARKTAKRIGTLMGLSKVLQKLLKVALIAASAVAGGGGGALLVGTLLTLAGGELTKVLQKSGVINGKQARLLTMAFELAGSALMGGGLGGLAQQLIPLRGPQLQQAALQWTSNLQKLQKSLEKAPNLLSLATDRQLYQSVLQLAQGAGLRPGKLISGEGALKQIGQLLDQGMDILGGGQKGGGVPLRQLLRAADWQRSA